MPRFNVVTLWRRLMEWMDEVDRWTQERDV